MMDPWLVDDLLRRALAEDIGRGDRTTDAIVPPDVRLTGVFVARTSGRIAGLSVAARALALLDPDVQTTLWVKDGDDVESGTALMRVTGRGRALLSGERVALNLLMRLSGIATATREIVRKVADLPVRIVDTRKTMPLLRVLDKYAVRVGGGANHRFGLDDAVLIKDNHLAVAGSIREAVARVRRHVGPFVPIEVEVERPEDVDEAVAAGVTAVLLDNMTLSEMREAVRRAGRRMIVEASGGITPENVRAVAETGVDLISLGWLTHSVRALDIAFDLE
ncbi:MAG: Quinolinate phosphoribosyltransferase [decarboxylating] [Hydrogenibacillus schlegelii]|uniref:Probable nicotinate-nucleotide pyrophosphorylase [carboxylating] n=1 Tax=Hydrogenibacillus schlegelii TaxID=1484 RepID=A0A2T5GDS2_HYDSH|nr:MAG: Quinolinate phosphoribosyltransferase [decarboxylating] [Hydrogenibacillus schlegelii]